MSRTLEKRLKVLGRPVCAGLSAAFLLLSTAVVGVYGLYAHALAVRRADIQDQLADFARVAATLVDGDLHRNFVAPEQEQTAEYRAAIEPLGRMLRSLAQVRFLYTVRLCGDQVFFVLDATPAGDADGDGVEDHSAIMEPYTTPDPAMLAALREGRCTSASAITIDRWGATLSGYAPLFDSAGEQVGAIGVDITARTYLAETAALREAAVRGMLPVTAMCLLVGTVVYAFRRAELHAERERERMTSLLGEHERKLTALLGDLPGMAYRCRNDRDLTMEFVSEGATVLTGYAPEVFTRGELRYAAVIHSDDRAPVWRERQEALERQETFRLTYRIHAGSEGLKWVLEQGRGIWDAAGALVALEGFITDISERKAAELELRRAKEAAEAASNAKTEFLANVSHELRTPLTAILGYADLISGGCPRHCACGEQDLPEYVEVVRRNGENLLQLINDVLDVSKIEAGALELEQVACSPLSLLAETESLLRVSASRKGLRFEVEMAGPVPELVTTDPVRVRQILTNLVGNAVKFTESGSVRLTMSYRRDAAPTLHFEVVDTGIGMGAAQLARLFQPFSQADNSTSRRFGGTGLGLVISRRLARLLGGDISVASEPGVGSHFQVTIAAGVSEPVRMIAPLASAVVPQGGARGGRGLGDEPRLRGCRVLLAEDGPDNQRLIALLLRTAGAQVTVVSDGRGAVEAALASHTTGSGFDLILMDMQMPVMDGYSATAALRARGYRGRIVALTAHAMSDDRTKCLQAGCDDYVSKPVKRGTLLELVARHATPSKPAQTVT